MLTDTGELSERITLLRPVYPDNAVGEAAPSYEPLREVWAKARPLTARAVATFRQAEIEASVEFTLRFPPDLDLTAQHRVAWKGEEYAVRNLVDPNNRHEWLVLTCATTEPGKRV